MRSIFTVLSVLTLLALSGPEKVLAAPARVIVPLHAVGRGQVTGMVILTADGPDTAVRLKVRHLPSRARVRAMLHAGRCSALGHLSASFADLPSLTANASGEATASGRVRFHVLGHENVPFKAISNGGHVIVIAIGSRVAACGDVPRRHAQGN